MDFRSLVVKCVPFLSPIIQTDKSRRRVKEHTYKCICKKVWTYLEWSLRNWPPWCSCFWCQVSTWWCVLFPLCSSAPGTYSSWRRTKEDSGMLHVVTAVQACCPIHRVLGFLLAWVRQFTLLLEFLLIISGKTLSRSFSAASPGVLQPYMKTLFFRLWPWKSQYSTTSVSVTNLGGM